MTPAPESSGARTLFRWPRSLLQRVRWLMLLAGLAIVLTNAPDGLRQGADIGLPWPLAVVALVSLIALWVTGYLRGGFSLLTDVLTGAALALLGAFSPHPREMAFPLYTSAWMRALHSTPRDTTRAMVIYIAGFAVGGALAAGRASDLAVYIASRSAVAAVLVVAFGLIGIVLDTYDATIVRERRLRQAARTLAEARDRQSIYAAALSGVRGLLAPHSSADGDRVAVELAVGTTEDATVVAAAGSGAGATGGHIRLSDLPEATGAALARGESVELRDASPHLWNALKLEPRGGALYAFPLAGRGTLDGAILAGSARPLDAEVRDDLETLADLAALAVESQLLLEARQSGAVPLPAATDDTPYDRVHARLGTAVGAASALVARAATPLWPAPADLPTRVRWIFLGLAIVLSLGTGIPALLGLLRGPFDAPQLIAAAAPLWLGAWFVYGYRRSGFPLVGDIVNAALLAVVLAAVPSQVGQFALFTSMMFRAVYGSRARVLLAGALHAAALVAAAVLAPGRGMAAAGVGGVAAYFSVMAVVGAVIYSISATLRNYERALVRGRVLRVAGAHLVAATTRAHVYDATLDGGRALLATRADGGAASQQIHLRDQLYALRASFPQPTPVDQPHATQEAWRAFDLQGDAAALYALPLHARGDLEGALVAGTATPLDAELKDDLQTLAALAALALEDVILAGEATP